MSEWVALRLLSAEGSQDWGIIGSTVVTGIVVVFLILAILVGFLSLMGMILQGKKKSAPSAPAAEKPAAAAPVVNKIEDEAEEDEDDGEIIAVISAAIAAYGEAEGKQYRIASVKKRDRAVRSGWSAAGIAENTRGLS
ncbi:MAG: OadG family protein [Ruminiclostridium sp.]|nr:OadG family protein [Ruminiclostridium sp.]